MSQVPNTSPSNADFDVENSTGANVRGDLNNILDAILTMNSGGSGPSYAKAYTLWADTTAGTMKIRNAANDAWIELFQLDGTLTLEDGSASTPALAFRDDLNTGIFSSAENKINFSTGGTEKLELGATTIFNENGEDIDFRIEGDNQANLFYVDAGNDRIGVGTASPTNVFTVIGTGNDAGIDLTSTGAHALRFKIDSNQTSADDTIFFQSARWNGTEVASIHMRAGADTTNKDDGRLTFHTATSGSSNAERMRIDSSGNVGIGTTSPASPLHLHESSSGSIEGLKVTNSTTGTGITDGLSIGLDSSENVFIFNYESTAMKFGTSDTERMRIDSSGNVMIGQTSANALFDVNGQARFGGNKVTLDTDGSISQKISNSTTLAFMLSNTDVNADFFGGRVFQIGPTGTVFIGGTPGLSPSSYSSPNIKLDPAGNSYFIGGDLGIGTSSPLADLHVTDGSSGDGTIQVGGTNTSAAGQLFYELSGSTFLRIKNLYRSNSSNGSNAHIEYDAGFHKFLSGTGGSERMRLDSSGRFLINTTSTLSPINNARLQVNTTTSEGVFFRSTGDTSINLLELLHGRAGTNSGAFSGFFVSFRNNAQTQIGSIVGSTSITYNTTSDYRLKENIETLSDAITRLKTLNPVRFNWKAASEQPKVDGFLAHEVTAVPESITGTKDQVDSDNKPVYQQIDQSKLVPLLVAAVKELITKVETLEAA